MNKLFITRLTERALEMFENEPYTRATKDYLLVYTDNDVASDTVAEVPTDAWARLTKAESMWLTKCQVDIINSELMKKAPEVVESINKRIDALEKALEAERVNAREGEADAEQLE